MIDVAPLCCIIDRARLHAEVVLQEIKDGTQRNTGPPADIEHLAGWIGRGCREISTDNVAHIGKIARLQAVPVYGDILAREHSLDKLVKSHIRALPGAVDREVAQGDGGNGVA